MCIAFILYLQSTYPSKQRYLVHQLKHSVKINLLAVKIATSSQHTPLIMSPAVPA